MSTADILAGGGVLAVVMTLIQIAPVKINPWSWIARSLGRAMTGELIDKVDNLARDFSEDRALTARWHILRFNDELLQNERHSKECFDQVLEDITKYKKYCREHEEFENERAVLAIENVERCYRKCTKDRDFL